MKCVLCGRESTKPVCSICAKQIIFDNPFILTRSLLVGDYESPQNEMYFFNRDIKRINERAKKVLLEGGEDATDLARIALIFHHKFSFILGNVEVEENYYLKLARELASKSEDSEAKYLLAKIALEEGNADDAEGILRDIWKEKREYAILYGKALVASGKWMKAVEVYNEILSDNKEDAEIWKLLADALFSSGNYEDAERTYLKVLQINKDDYEAWYKRGLCLRKIGKWGGALQSFQTAVRKNPKFREAYEEIISILEERGMYSRALETLRRMREEGFDVDDRIREMERRVEG